MPAGRPPVIRDKIITVMQTDPARRSWSASDVVYFIRSIDKRQIEQAFYNHPDAFVRVFRGRYKLREKNRGGDNQTEQRSVSAR